MRRMRPAAATYCPGTDDPADPEADPVLAGVAPSSTVTLEIFQVDWTFCRLTMTRSTSDWGVEILLLAKTWSTTP